MYLHAIYRSVGVENRKPRPPGYSKPICLRSFLRAREACPNAGELLFLNDGPIPPDLVATMQRTGEIVARAALDLHGSYWAAIDLALERGWADDDLVYLAEDDYLYRRRALVSLSEAAGRLPSDTYLALYATIGDRMPNGEPLHPGLRRPASQPDRLTEADGVSWHRGLSHTSTFAARVGVLRADRPLHSVAPRCSGAWDHALALAYQGRPPYGPRAHAEPLLEDSGASGSRRAKTVVWRGALAALAVAARPRHRLLAGPVPALATHMEAGVMARGTDWDAEAEAARSWGDA